MIASQLPIDTTTLAQRIGAGASGPQLLGTSAEIAEFTAGAPLLTDDYAPVDQLISRNH